MGWIFKPSGALDVNPVIWHELLRGGVALRGQDVSAWGLGSESHELKPWTWKNLTGYWKPLMARTEKGRGVLGPGGWSGFSSAPHECMRRS